MKVYNLLESIEWKNKDMTRREFLEHLWKRQLSAVHTFVIKAYENKFYNSRIVDHAGAFLNNTTSGMLKVLCKTVQEHHPKLIKYCDVLIKAKKEYEQAGGKYEGK